MSKKEKKQYSLDRKRFFVFITILVIIIISVIIIIALNKKPEINGATDISKLNSEKYYEQILEIYNKEGMKEKFLEEYNDIQGKIGMYIINNSTNDKNSFVNLVNDVNSKLKNKSFKSFEIETPNSWNGTWSIDEKAKLKFKFENKKIEPDWIKDAEFNEMIIKN